ncbi:hypothetical protein LCGC14_2774040 [marine sediment metagenome]|uniref:Uncharacterized protein n=1 Tax=marine sediment metagenome TaxID=412755 RepID=A0A0F9BLX6_9ZZZZ
MIEVTRVPVNPVPQKFTYIVELSELRASFLLGLLKLSRCSVTAAKIVEGLKKAGLE